LAQHLVLAAQPLEFGSHVFLSLGRRVVHLPLTPAVDPVAQRREPDAEISGDLPAGPPARLRQSHRLSTKLRGKGLLPVCHRNPPPSGKELSTFPALRHFVWLPRAFSGRVRMTELGDGEAARGSRLPVTLHRERA